jgi:L-threonylcarbamoyladenylate synthase
VVSETATLNADDARRMQECIVGGGVVLFPADTVYGVGCDPENHTAVARLYALKGRPPQRPAAVMFFGLDIALAALPGLGERELHALRALLPGPLTLLLPNRGGPSGAGRFLPACGPDPQTLGLRVPLIAEGPRAEDPGVEGPLAEGPLAALADVTVPVMQSSANLSGQADARRLADVPAALRAGVDLALDGGELPGVASTVLDLRDFQERREWRVVRAGPVGEGELVRVLG